MSNLSTALLQGADTSRGMPCLLYSGGFFYLETPSAEEVLIRDIAHALSLQCRYNGHVREFYSVAQHLVLCSRAAELLGFDEEIQFEALMHDATEAYVSDLPRPVKALLPEYYEIEDRAYRVIAEKYDLPPAITPAVKEIDNRVLHTEGRDFGLSFGRDWGNEIEGAYDFIHVDPVGPAEAEVLFMQRFCDLTGFTIDQILQGEV